MVALLDYQRFRAGRAIGSVTFSRRAGAVGSITIPAGTPITDAADKIRYVTTERYDMQAGETTAEVRIQGAAAATPVVDAGVLTVIQRAIAGLDSVTNPRPTTQATADETDEALRARARDALLAANKGTLEAMRNGLLAVQGVRDAKIEEMPNGIPGEIRVTVSLAEPPPGGDLPPEVLARIEELRPAGIRVLKNQAGQTALAANVALVLAGSALPPAAVEAVHEGVRGRLTAEIARRGVGERIRVKPLVAALLADERIVDATLTLAAKGGAAAEPGSDFQPDAGTSVSLDPADIAFAADTFATAAAAAGQAVRVEVRATIGVILSAGVTPDAAKAELTARLSDFFGKLAPGATVNSAAVLAALKNDARYGLDPLKLVGHTDRRRPVRAGRRRRPGLRRPAGPDFRGRLGGVRRMTTLERILDVLPPPYSTAADSTLAALLGVFALECDALGEDIDRLRRTHWINQAYRFEDATRLGALLGISPLPWETLESYRARLLPLAASRLDGTLAPGDIRAFVHDYLRNAEDALDATFVPGMPTDEDQAFRMLPDRPLWRPLELAENPPRLRPSPVLAARNGSVPHLFRWTEHNNGLDEALVTFRIAGLSGGRTAVPVLLNLSSGDMIFYADRLLPGAELNVASAGDAASPRLARATLDGNDVTRKLRSVSRFALGSVLEPGDCDLEPRLPQMLRGANDWLFVALGIYDVRGFDQVFFALADDALFEGAFDQTRFDHALFPSGPRARLAIEWTETEPASFEVRIPRGIVFEPAGSPADAAPHTLVGRRVAARDRRAPRRRGPRARPLPAVRRDPATDRPAPAALDPPRPRARALGRGRGRRHRRPFRREQPWPDAVRVRG